MLNKSSSCSSIGHTAIAAEERGDDTASAACTLILYRVCYDPPPMNTPVREGDDDRGVPYHAESTLSSAQVLKTSRSHLELNPLILLNR